MMVANVLNRHRPMALPTLAIIDLLPATSPRADWAFSG